MKYQKLKFKLDELVLVTENLQDPMRHEHPIKFFGFGDNNISYLGLENIDKFNKTIDAFFCFHKEITDTWTFYSFEKRFTILLTSQVKEKRDATENEIEEFFASFLNEELQQSEVLYDLYGARSNKALLEFGGFNVYNLALLPKHLEDKYPYLDEYKYLLQTQKSRIVLGINVSARENSKAVEKADKLCTSFENALSYMLADFEHKNIVRVFNFQGNSALDVNIMGKIFPGHISRKKVFFPVDLDNSYFIDSDRGHRKIWGLITKSDKTEMEKRLLESIEWVGKAVYNDDLAMALVQLVISVETMLKFDENAFVSGSIVSQLSEWLAFILHDKTEERKKVSKYFKELYRDRSAITHGGSKSLNIQDLQVGCQICKQMVTSFLVTQPFCDMKTIKDLSEYMTELKFR